MASLRIRFPENPEPTLVVLRGPRITLGRKPDNTIQIAERTISAHHVEFLSEGGHYRLRDLNSTNGVFVNGERVAEYHLKDACALRLGTMECQFTLENGEPGSDHNVELTPTRAEIKALRTENIELLVRVATLTEQIAEARALAPVVGGVSAADYHRVLSERADLKQALHRREQEIDSLRRECAVLLRDRDSYRMHYALLARSTAGRTKTTDLPGNSEGAALQESPSNIVPIATDSLFRAPSVPVPMHRPGGKSSQPLSAKGSGAIRSKSATRIIPGTNPAS